MKNKPLKALILAAGFGTRLKPFTNTYPKPLVPFFSLTPLELNLEKIKKQSKIQNVAFNTHYLQNVLSPFVFNLEKNFDRPIMVQIANFFPKIVARILK